MAEACREEFFSVPRKQLVGKYWATGVAQPAAEIYSGGGKIFVSYFYQCGLDILYVIVTGEANGRVRGGLGAGGSGPGP